jgi:transposase
MRAGPGTGPHPRPAPRPRCRPAQLAGDTGYRYPRRRRQRRRRGIRAVIPRRKDRRPAAGRGTVDRGTDKRRAVVEPCVGWLKESRAVATRCDKLAVNYLAPGKRAMTHRYLRRLARE